MARVAFASLLQSQLSPYQYRSDFHQFAHLADRLSSDGLQIPPEPDIIFEAFKRLDEGEKPEVIMNSIKYNQHTALSNNKSGVLEAAKFSDASQTECTAEFAVPEIGATTKGNGIFTSNSG